MHEISRCDLNKGSPCGLDFLNKSSQITLHGGHILVTASGSRQLLGCASALGASPKPPRNDPTEYGVEAVCYRI